MQCKITIVESEITRRGEAERRRREEEEEEGEKEVVRHRQTLQVSRSFAELRNVPFGRESQETHNSSLHKYPKCPSPVLMLIRPLIRA